MKKWVLGLVMAVLVCCVGRVGSADYAYGSPIRFSVLMHSEGCSVLRDTLTSNFVLSFGVNAQWYMLQTDPLSWGGERKMTVDVFGQLTNTSGGNVWPETGMHAWVSGEKYSNASGTLTEDTWGYGTEVRVDEDDMIVPIQYQPNATIKGNIYCRGTNLAERVWCYGNHFPPHTPRYEAWTYPSTTIVSENSFTVTLNKEDWDDSTAPSHQYPEFPSSGWDDPIELNPSRIFPGGNGIYDPEIIPDHPINFPSESYPPTLLPTPPWGSGIEGPYNKLDPNNWIDDTIHLKVTHALGTGAKAFFEIEFDDCDAGTTNPIHRVPSTSYVTGTGSQLVSWTADECPYEDDDFCDVTYRVIIREYNYDTNALVARTYHNWVFLRPVVRD